MCGIAGYYNPTVCFSDNPKSNFKILNNMIDTLKKRGPDNRGISILKNCCFAHTRLSIIDLETGNQPMKVFYNENVYHIVFNGEIYNFPKLKKDLINRGFSFNTKSDVEVIAKAYIHYGPLFANLLDGIFAIAIYDEANNSLNLFRDHFGVKPLYYSMYGKTLVFASRIDTLFEYPGIRPQIDLNSFNEILSLGPAKTYGSGVFIGIKELLPGEYLIYTPDYMTKKQYYTLKSKPHYDSYDETVEKTRYLIENAVQSQMLSDVPICTFLSGGIDSSLVTSICAKKLGNNKLDTYSFDFTDNDKNFVKNSFQSTLDRPYVDIMKEYLNTNHKYLYCNYDELFDSLYESVDSRCLPTMADVDASLLYFCKIVSKNHKCVLTGECADEIFGGYPWFHREEMLNSQTFPWMPDLSFRKSFLNTEFAAALHMEKYVSKAYNKTVSEVQILPGETKEEAQRRKICYLNIRWFMQTLLDRMDRTSMNCGLEARVPFANRELIDYVFNIPWSIKCKDNTPKALLCEAATTYLPASIINRKKNPYPKTYDPKYTKRLTDELRLVINDSSSPLRSYININALNKFMDAPVEYGKPWYGQLMAGPQMLAYLLQINYWMRKYSLSI